MIEYIVKWAIVVSTGFGSLWPSYQLKQTDREYEVRFDSLHHAEAFYDALQKARTSTGELIEVKGLFKVENLRQQRFFNLKVDSTIMIIPHRFLVDTSVMEIRSIINVSNPTKTQTP